MRVSRKIKLRARLGYNAKRKAKSLGTAARCRDVCSAMASTRPTAVKEEKSRDTSPRRGRVCWFWSTLPKSFVRTAVDIDVLYRESWCSTIQGELMKHASLRAAINDLSTGIALRLGSTCIHLLGRYVRECKTREEDVKLSYSESLCKQDQAERSLSLRTQIIRQLKPFSLITIFPHTLTPAYTPPPPSQTKDAVSASPNPAPSAQTPNSPTQTNSAYNPPYNPHSHSRESARSDSHS